MANAALGFYPWIRRGLGIAITRPDGDTASASPATKFQVEVSVFRRPENQDDRFVEVGIPLIGPGDIVGLNAATVIRTFPSPNESDAEFGHFAYVEFDQLDLPWRYSPAMHVNHRLRPWLALLVVPDSEVTIEQPGPANPLPKATIQPGALPKATQAWAWSHVQLNGAELTETAAIEAAIAANATKGLGSSRLYSPRFLIGSTSYTALVVPLYKRGALAGLGSGPPIDGGPDALELAWSDSPTSAVELPVYYQWRFQTGTTGSFAELAGRLAPRILPNDIGLRGIDVSEPGLELDPPTNAMSVEGASKGEQTASSPWSDSEKDAWRGEIGKYVNNIDDLIAGTGVEKVIAPPLYGQWHAARARLQPNDGRPWFYELNLDPRNRVAAGLGTQVVQRNQEALLASAWEQFDDLRQINVERRRLQIARDGSGKLWKRHVLSASRDQFLQLTNRLQDRISSGNTNESVFAKVSTSQVRVGVLDPIWRRMTAPLGRPGRLQGRSFFAETSLPGIADRLNDGAVFLATPPQSPNGLLTWRRALDGRVPAVVDDATRQAIASESSTKLVFYGLVLIYAARHLLTQHQGNYWWLLAQMVRLGTYFVRVAANPNGLEARPLVDGMPDSGSIAARGIMPNFVKLPEQVPDVSPGAPWPAQATGSDSPDAASLRSALLSLFGQFDQPLVPIEIFKRINLDLVRTRLVEGLSPEVTTVEIMQKRLTAIPGTRLPADYLEPLMVAPEFSQPMFRPLRELSNEWILPGLGEVPADTVALLDANQKFIEAYMAGLNHEMARELLFHEFPTDQRGTYFRQFWDNAGAVADVPIEQTKDITPMHLWRTNALGQNSPRRDITAAGKPPHILLLVRGEIIRRYPNIIVYAMQSGGGQTLTGTPMHPAFFADLPPDAALYGFELTKESLTAGNGYYFILQEQPAEPKFGIFPQPTSTYFDADVALPGEQTNSHTSADIAEKTYVQPFRVAVHASTLTVGTP
jgi:hypothetical protein